MLRTSERRPDERARWLEAREGERERLVVERLRLVGAGQSGGGSIIPVVRLGVVAFGGSWRLLIDVLAGGWEIGHRLGRKSPRPRGENLPIRLGARERGRVGWGRVRIG